MPYCVRPMRKEDIPQVNEIDREAFPTQWPPPNYRHELDNQFAHYLVATDASRTVEGAESKPGNGLLRLFSRIMRWFQRSTNTEPPMPGSEYVIGFAGIWIMADESHLTNIAVRQAYQRRGVGELLVICVIDLSARLKADNVTLEVRVSNSPAQTLYRKYSFAEVGVRRGYYTDNREDALLMSTEKMNTPAFQEKYLLLKKSHLDKWGAANCRIIEERPVRSGR